MRLVKELLHRKANKRGPISYGAKSLMRGGVRVAAILKAQTPEALAKIEKAVSDSAAACQADRGVQVPMLAGLLPLENASGPHPLLANTQCHRKSRGNSVIRSASKQNLWSA
jgi:hypothetical protein